MAAPEDLDFKKLMAKVHMSHDKLYAPLKGSSVKQAVHHFNGFKYQVQSHVDVSFVDLIFFFMQFSLGQMIETFNTLDKEHEALMKGKPSHLHFGKVKVHKLLDL